MKNRLLYLLIGLMTVALVGITSIQVIWISNAIEERESEMAIRVGKALNEVNDQIEESEIERYTNLSFGNIDSLVNEMLEGPSSFISENDSNQFVYISKSDSPKVHVKIQDGNTFKVKDSHRTEIRIDGELDSIDSELAILSQKLGNLDFKNMWTNKIEHKHTVSGDSSVTIEMQMVNNDAAIIGEHVAHKTIRSFFGNQSIDERISKEQLRSHLTRVFTEKQLGNDFSFAVFNNQNEVDALTANDFKANNEDAQFRKELFPFDESEGNYELVVLMGNQGEFVWAEVKPMVLLSILFTLLILFCFGYSLYVIFKQKKISQIKDDFVNNMTHELKTPLATISLAADSIKHPGVINDNEEIKHFVSMIKNEETRMNAQIEKVLEIAALDKGELVLNKQELNLNELIEKCIGHIKLSLKEAGGAITFNSNNDSLLAEVDPFHFENVLNNLMDNSIKYREENLEIQVDLKEEDGYILLSVKDNGMGMSKKAQSLAFDKFYREEGGNVHSVKGYGLGLTYVKKIIVLHKGEVELANSKSGGLEVLLKIPAHGN